MLEALQPLPSASIALCLCYCQITSVGWKCGLWQFGGNLNEVISLLPSWCKDLLSATKTAHSRLQLNDKFLFPTLTLSAVTTKSKTEIYFYSVSYSIEVCPRCVCKFWLVFKAPFREKLVSTDVWTSSFASRWRCLLDLEYILSLDRFKTIDSLQSLGITVGIRWCEWVWTLFYRSSIHAGGNRIHHLSWVIWCFR